MAFLDRSTFERFHPRLQRADPKPSDFVIEARGNVTVGYVPFHYVNESARLLIVGITPGAAQAEIALTECSAALRQGASPITACRRAKYAASFAGAMRTNLVSMLDELGITSALEISTTADLFTEHQRLLDTGSVLPYPIFVNGRNYTGHLPPLRPESWIWQ